MKLNTDGKIEWHGVINGHPVVIEHEPDTNVFKRMMNVVLKLAPEGQL